MNAPAEKPRPQPLTVGIDILDDWQRGQDFVIWNGSKDTPVNVHRMAAATVYDPNRQEDWVLFVEFDCDRHTPPYVIDYYVRTGSTRLVELAGGEVPRFIDGLIVDELDLELDRYASRQAGP